MTRQILLSKTVPAAVLVSTCLLAAKIDYHDPSELASALNALRQSSAHVQMLTIGYSPSIPSGSSVTRYPIKAVRISSSTETSIKDNPDRNGILFECGMHPREWLSTESCLKLAEYFANNAENLNSGVPTLLRNADVYIVPLTTVAGRWLDDQHEGDPERFSRDPSSTGWRGNGDLRDCEYGINVARNFSSGWDGAAAGCDGNYRGFAPFSSEEAVALRAFVQNHGITMAVVVHSNVEEINNYWNDDPGNVNVGFARWAWRAGLDDMNLGLEETGRGTGVGQFTAWLASASDAAGQPDRNTVRGIRTIMLELPFLAENYKAPYRNAANDDSNGFHPSGDGVLTLIDRSFIPMAKVLASYAGYPVCSAGASCPAVDFGLAGAKIARGYFDAGAIESQPAYRFFANGKETIQPARDYLPVGGYSVYYRALNLTNTAGDADVQVTIDDGRNSTPTITTHRLAKYSGTAASVAFEVAGDSTDYTVTIEIRPAGGFRSGVNDGFRNNNKKVFKFRSYQLN